MGTSSATQTGTVAFQRASRWLAAGKRRRPTYCFCKQASKSRHAWGWPSSSITSTLMSRNT
eukprot:11548404-Alexandrium_andersonii.AAC.1